MKNIWLLIRGFFERKHPMTTSDTTSPQARTLDQIQAAISSAKSDRNDISARETAISAEKLVNANLLTSLIAEWRTAVATVETEFSDIETDVKSVIGSVETEVKNIVGAVETKVEAIVSTVENAVSPAPAAVAPVSPAPSVSA
jgi:predicted neutral ceramidase superfamily lipid hydrolase